MSSNEYHFVTHWRVPGTVEDVAEVLSDPEDLPRWWPSVYLDVQETKPGDEDGIGKEASLYTKGWLPYALRWQFRVTESNYPHGFAFKSWGDFDGRGEWILRQDGDWVELIYDWRIRAEKPLLRRLSFLLKPFFAANHQWAMRRGEESLRLELARRAAPERHRHLYPSPPPATGWRTFLAPVAAGLLVVVLAIGAARSIRSGSKSA